MESMPGAESFLQRETAKKYSSVEKGLFRGSCSSGLLSKGISVRGILGFKSSCCKEMISGRLGLLKILVDLAGLDDWKPLIIPQILLRPMEGLTVEQNSLYEFSF